MIPLIDYARGELRGSLHGRRFQMETYVPLCCPRCGGERWLRKYDAERAVARGSVCTSCQKAQAGSVGYAVTLAKYGRMFVMRKVREYRLLRITTLELLVMRELLRHGVHFDREVLLPTKAHGRKQRVYILDFALWQPGTGDMAGAIEVQSLFVHSQPERIQADKRKRSLLKRRRVPLLEIWEDDIEAGRMPGQVKSFLQSLSLIRSRDDVHRQPARAFDPRPDRSPVDQSLSWRGARFWRLSHRTSDLQPELSSERRCRRRRADPA